MKEKKQKSLDLEPWSPRLFFIQLLSDQKSNLTHPKLIKPNAPICPIVLRI